MQLDCPRCRIGSPPGGTTIARVPASVLLLLVLSVFVVLIWPAMGMPVHPG